MRWMLVALAGCALTSKSAPVELRYFSPEPAAVAASAAPAQTAARPRLRLGRIAPGAYLRAPIVHRDSELELAPYETLRWTEPPDVYVRRALARALFERQAIDQAVGGPAPTLDVEIVAFEEVRHALHRAGRVELAFVLHDERAVLARGSVAVERAAAGPAIEQIVPAIASALDSATAQVADRVAAALASR